MTDHGIDAARWERIQALFHEAADLEPGAQRLYLQRAAAGDEVLIAAVLELLDQDALGSPLLDRGVAHAASRILGPDPTVSLPDNDFGPYRLTRLLGEGGMGVVYLAQRRDLGSFAAIKLLRDSWLSPARRERFASEQRTLAQLNHPAIARLYDADVLQDGTPWFAMEYVDGAPLTTYCEEHGASITERLRLFRAVCEAVQHAHRHTVIHRDLKPSNILVTRDGSVKLLDFGIAKQLESVGRPADNTQTGLRLMTPAYAAPEQVRSGQIGSHTDVYSLGVILYQLLTGRLPFDLSNRTPEEAATVIVDREPERPSSVANRTEAGLSRTAWADLDVLCLTAMHKDPERRYRTVEALVRDLDHYLEGEPLEARPDKLGYRLGKFVRRNRGPVAVATVTLLTIATLVVFYTVRLTRARNEAVAEAARTQRIQRFMLNLFQNGDESTAPSESLRVVAVIDRGLQEAKSLSGEPAIQAELSQTLGTLYQQLGNFTRADSLLSAALDARKALHGPDHPDVARSLVALGLLRNQQSRYDEAEQLVRDALAIDRRHLTPDHPAVANAMAALGTVLQERGQYAAAIQVLDTALALSAARDSTSPEYAAVLGDLAKTHFFAGHYDLADSLHQRVLAMSRRLYGERHPHVASDLADLGQIQQMRGAYAAGEQYFRQALEIAQGWYGADNPQTASYLTMVGRALLYQDKYDDARVALEASLKIQERAYGPDHPNVANALNELGSVAWKEHRLDQAEAYRLRVLKIYRAAYGEKHQFVGVALANLAGVYQERKEYRRAEQLYREALETYKGNLAPDHINVGIGRIKLGRVLLRERRFSEAAAETLAGYEILIKQTDPATSFIKAARNDLIIDYDSLGQPEKAARFQRALADTTH
jgi:eukaryotic-like serine/threonine-protein kinase